MGEAGIGCCVAGPFCEKGGGKKIDRVLREVGVGVGDSDQVSLQWPVGCAVIGIRGWSCGHGTELGENTLLRRSQQKTAESVRVGPAGNGVESIAAV